MVCQSMRPRFQLAVDSCLICSIVDKSYLFISITVIISQLHSPGPLQDEGLQKYRNYPISNTVLLSSEMETPSAIHPAIYESSMSFYKGSAQCINVGHGLKSSIKLL